MNPAEAEQALALATTVASRSRFSRAEARSAAGLRNCIANAESVRGERLVLRVEVIASDKQHGSAEKVVTARAK